MYGAGVMAKSSAYPPLDGLLDLACRDGVDIRPTLLRVLTDLYVQKPAHGAEDEAQYVELALRLIEAVDAPTRASVMATLSAHANAPASVLRRLSEIAASAGPASSASADTARTPEHELAELFFAANPDERHLILTNLDVTGDDAPRLPPPATSEVIRLLENAALSRNTGEFSRVLQRALGIGRKLSDRVARDHFGEPIVVAARVLGMKAAVLQRVLLFLNPVVGQSVQRVYDLARLYDEITPAAAERMVAIWRTASGGRDAQHVPAHHVDNIRSSRDLSTPSRHRSQRDDSARTPGAKVNER